MADTRLSLVPPPTCDHVCCTRVGNWGHDEPNHLHLFAATECPSCQLDGSRTRHPSASGYPGGEAT